MMNDPEKEEKVRRLIDDKQKLSEAMRKNFADDESIDKITKSLETPAMKRFVMLHQSDPKIKKSVMALPRAQRKEIEKKSSKSKKKDNTPSIKIVQMKPSGVLRPFALSAPFGEGEEWETYVLENGLRALFDTKEQCKNRHASRLVGKDVHGVVYFFSVNDQGESIDLSIEEFRSITRTLVAQ